MCYLSHSQCEMKEEHQEELDEINEELDDLEAEKKEIMTEEDYLALQKKIEDKEAEAQSEKDILEDIETKNEQTLDNKDLAEENHIIAKEKAETDYDIRKKEREKAFAIEKATLERKQAENNKAMQYFNAVISMATGASGAAFVLGAPIMIPLLAGIAGTMGAIQIATIKATPLPAIPSYAVGGYIDDSNIGNYRHFGLTAPAGDDTLAFVKSGEFVLSERDLLLMQNKNSINNSSNTTNSNITNEYNVAVNVAETNSNPRAIAKAVVKAIGGRI